jgi:hypothetical protein
MLEETHCGERFFEIICALQVAALSTFPNTPSSIATAPAYTQNQAIQQTGTTQFQSAGSGQQQQQYTASQVCSLLKPKSRCMAFANSTPANALPQLAALKLLHMNENNV